MAAQIVVVVHPPTITNQIQNLIVTYDVSRRGDGGLQSVTDQTLTIPRSVFETSCVDDINSLIIGAAVEQIDTENGDRVTLFGGAVRQETLETP